jgi:hypothetical protein
MLAPSDIQLPTDGWSPLAPDQETHLWSNRAGDLLSLDFFPIPPDLPSSVRDIDTLRALYRSKLGDGGAIVEMDPMEVGGVLSLRGILKFPQHPTGMTYLGAVTLPFRDCSFVLKWQCPEHGMTGARDSTVFALVSPPMSSDGVPIGWRQDPYLPSHKGKCLRNQSDDTRWDAQFPDHPLSRVRSYLARLPSIRFSERAAHEPPFVGAPVH